MRTRGRATYHHGHLREALLDSVERIIRKRGVAFVSLREVARDAHVSHSASAHHFGNKAGLLTAFAAQSFQRMANVVASELRKVPNASAPDKLEALGRGYVRFAIENPERFSVMFRSELIDEDAPEFRASADAAYALLTTIVSGCHDEGYLRGRDLDAVTKSAWAVAHGLAALWTGGRLQARARASDGNALAARVLRDFVDQAVRVSSASGHRSSRRTVSPPRGPSRRGRPL